MFKAYSWWNYKIPPMLAVAFYALCLAPVTPPVGVTLRNLALFLVSVIGIAGFGHVFLDAFDVEEDRISGKPNLWANASATTRVMLILGLAAASWLPWLILSNTRLGLLLIGFEFVLFLLYAVPPVRLKTRGFAGIVADAGYAHVLPALWTWIPFALIAGVRTSRIFIIALAVWALLVGMRHLIYHQALEAAEDRAAGTMTFAVRYGARESLSLVVERLLPLEVISFGLLLAVMGIHVIALPIVFIVYCAFEIYRFRVLWIQAIHLTEKLPASDRATIEGTLVLSQFYELWFPVVLLGALAWKSLAYLIIFALYLLIFRNGPVEFFRRDLPLLRRARGARAPA